MKGYELAVFLVGSPSFTFQSAASSIARTLETFPVGESVVFYSAFARREAEKISLFAKKLFDLELELRELSKDIRESRDAFQSILSRGKSLAVPTSGSLAGAVALTLAAAKTGADVGHVLFPFGPWTGFYYPYVPRYLQPMQVLGNPPEPRRPTFDREGALRHLNEETLFRTRLFKRIASLCVELNFSLPQAWVNEFSPLKLVLELSESVQEGRLSKTLSLKTTVATVPVCTLAELKVAERSEVTARGRSIGAHPPPDRKLFGEFVAEALSAIAGRGVRINAEECKERVYRLVGFEMLNLNPEEGYLIDTNLVYQGVHNVIRPAGPRIHIPYCVHAEVLDKVAESKSPCERLFAEILLMVYEVVELGVSKVPSSQYKCDIAVPAIDPELIKDMTVLTADKRAYQLWRKLAISRYTNVKLVDDSAFRSPSESEAHFALIQLAAILCELVAQQKSSAQG